MHALIGRTVCCVGFIFFPCFDSARKREEQTEIFVSFERQRDLFVLCFFHHFPCSVDLVEGSVKKLKNTHTHTHTHRRGYMKKSVCVCVCVCVLDPVPNKPYGFCGTMFIYLYVGLSVSRFGLAVRR